MKADINKTFNDCEKTIKMMLPTKQTSDDEHMRFSLEDGFQGILQMNGTECRGSKVYVNNHYWCKKTEILNIVECPMKQMYELMSYLDEIEKYIDELRANEHDSPILYHTSITSLLESIEKALSCITVKPKLLFPQTPTHVIFQFPHPKISADVWIEHCEIVLKLYLLNSRESEKYSPTILDGERYEEQIVHFHHKKERSAYLIENRLYWIQDTVEVHLLCSKLDTLYTTLKNIQNMWKSHLNNLEQLCSLIKC
ncbi:hypothetical protein QTN25_000404 [Entamoeba marina]